MFSREFWPFSIQTFSIFLYILQFSNDCNSLYKPDTWFKIKNSFRFGLGIENWNVWWMYLNRSYRKLEWEHAIKLRIIQLLITSLIFQLNKNFSHLSYTVLTTIQNDEKLHIFDSNSLVIFSIWAYYTWRDMYRWDECIWTGVIDNWNENIQ